MENKPKINLYQWAEVASFIVGSLLVFGAIKTAEYFTGGNQIESSKPIIPIKKLVINNNKVDTIYIYRKP